MLPNATSERRKGHGKHHGCLERRTLIMDSGNEWAKATARRSAGVRSDTCVSVRRPAVCGGTAARRSGLENLKPAASRRRTRRLDRVPAPGGSGDCRSNDGRRQAGVSRCRPSCQARRRSCRCRSRLSAQSRQRSERQSRNGRERAGRHAAEHDRTGEPKWRYRFGTGIGARPTTTRPRACTGWRARAGRRWRAAGCPSRRSSRTRPARCHRPRRPEGRAARAARTAR